MQPGEVQRWRMIAGTFDKFLQLQLAGHTLNEIAVDSLYLPKVDTRGVTQTVELDSGYRSDVLVKASSTPGTYMLTDSYAGQQSVLAAVVVQPTTPAPPKALPTTAEMQQLAYGWTGGVQNPTLESQWNADPVNHGPVADRHIQRMVFNFGPLTGTVTETNFAIDGNVYPDGPHRKLVLNRIDRWELVTNAGPTSNPHLFHIHVNPFQVVRPGPQPEAVQGELRDLAPPPPEILQERDEATPADGCHAGRGLRVPIGAGDGGAIELPRPGANHACSRTCLERASSCGRVDGSGIRT